MADNSNQALNAIKVLRKLEEVFSDGRYAAGWSDERVGKECGGLSKVFVASIRDAEFGPIKGDPEIDAIRSEIDTMRSMLSQMEARLNTAEKRLSGGR